MSNSPAAEAHDTDQHLIPDGVFIQVWIGLVILTAITVGGSVYFPGRVGIAVATIVTPLKAALILMYFMHLRYEKTVFKVMFLAAMGIFGMFMSLTFVDYLFR